MRIHNLSVPSFHTDRQSRLEPKKINKSFKKRCSSLSRGKNLTLQRRRAHDKEKTRYYTLIFQTKFNDNTIHMSTFLTVKLNLIQSTIAMSLSNCIIN